MLPSVRLIPGKNQETSPLFFFCKNVLLLYKIFEMR